METTEILVQVNIIFKEVLDNQELIINQETSANDVDDWDS